MRADADFFCCSIEQQRLDKNGVGVQQRIFLSATTSFQSLLGIEQSWFTFAA